MQIKNCCMRTILLSIACLVIGIAGTFAYSHYLGEGKQLAELENQLSLANSGLAKATQDAQKEKSEVDATSAQIQQLTATKVDLQHQLDAAKTAPVDASAPVVANPMAAMMKTVMDQQDKQKLQLLEARLHLTPDQIAAVKAAMDSERGLTEDSALKMFSGGKITPPDMEKFKGLKSVDATLDEVLTPDQKTAYTQMKAEEKNSSAELIASSEMNHVAPLLQLNDAQKDQVSNALYQVQLQVQDPGWIKKNVLTNSSDPLAILDAQEKAKEDALSKILTPAQVATYHQEQQSQLDMEKAMTQKFMPSVPATTPAAPVANP
jgi:hypothetical protein